MNFEYFYCPCCPGEQNSTRPLVISSEIGRVGNHNITFYSLIFFIAYIFKGQVHVFARQVKIVSHSPCRTSATLKYFCPLNGVYLYCSIWNFWFIPINHDGLWAMWLGSNISGSRSRRCKTQNTGNCKTRNTRIGKIHSIDNFKT